MLSDADLGLVRSFEKGPVTTCPFQTVTSAFYHHAASLPPDTLAVRDMSSSPPREVTYRELAIRAQSLAARLRSLGVRPGQRVPLVVKRGLGMVVGVWAVLSCGAQYVPLDGGVVPEATIRTVVEQPGGSSVVVCVSPTKLRLGELSRQRVVRAVVVDEQGDFDSVIDDSALDLATADGGCYVIYTSGAASP